LKRKQPLTQEQKWDEFRRASTVVLVDFDGTLCEFQYPDMGDPIPGAQEFMRSLFARGLQPVIWSSRMSPAIYTEEERAEAVENIACWAHRFGIPYHAIDTGASGKRLCVAYVDDRGVAARGDWDYMLYQIDKLAASEQAKEALRGREPCDGQSASTQD
jgi:hypothetical protein